MRRSAVFLATFLVATVTPMVFIARGCSSKVKVPQLYDIAVREETSKLLKWTSLEPDFAISIVGDSLRLGRRNEVDPTLLHLQEISLSDSDQLDVVIRQSLTLPIDEVEVTSDQREECPEYYDSLSMWFPWSTVPTARDILTHEFLQPDGALSLKAFEENAVGYCEVWGDSQCNQLAIKCGSSLGHKIRRFDLRSFPQRYAFGMGSAEELHIDIPARIRLLIGRITRKYSANVSMRSMLLEPVRAIKCEKESYIFLPSRGLLGIVDQKTMFMVDVTKLFPESVQRDVVSCIADIDPPFMAVVVSNREGIANVCVASMERSSADALDQTLYVKIVAKEMLHTASPLIRLEVHGSEVVLDDGYKMFLARF